jgi:hypothetical protein
LTAGTLYQHSSTSPFYFFVVGSSVCLVIGLAIYRWMPGAQTASRPPSLAEA